MGTMYETLMDLPLFKGLGKDQVSLMLEKTRFLFVNYKNKETIITPGDKNSDLRFIISGSVRFTHTNYAGNLRISETRNQGAMIGANHLFGMDTELPYTATAIGDTSILCISKDNFVNLLGMDHIYLLNYLNYLSLHVQRAEFCQRISSKGTVTEFIARCLLIFTEKTSYNIEIECTLRNISALINSTISETQLALKSLQRKELIEIDGKTIKVPSRLSLIDYVTPEQL